MTSLSSPHGSDAGFLREMIGFAAQRLMELETEELCGAAHGERTAERLNPCRVKRLELNDRFSPSSGSP